MLRRSKSNAMISPLRYRPLTRWRGDHPYQESSEQAHDGGAAFRWRMHKRALRAAKLLPQDRTVKALMPKERKNG